MGEEKGQTDGPTDNASVHECLQHGEVLEWMDGVSSKLIGKTDTSSKGRLEALKYGM